MSAPVLLLTLVSLHQVGLGVRAIKHFLIPGKSNIWVLGKCRDAARARSFCLLLLLCPGAAALEDVTVLPARRGGIQLLGAGMRRSQTQCPAVCSTDRTVESPPPPPSLASKCPGFSHSSARRTKTFNFPVLTHPWTWRMHGAVLGCLGPSVLNSWCW